MIRHFFVLALLLPAAAMAATGDDWITVNKDYSSQRYVDVSKFTSPITRENVAGLREVCEVALNEPSWFSSGILKIDDALYFTTRRMTYAVGAKDCARRWSNIIDEAPYPANYNNRGLGYLDNMLFRGTTNNKLIAINAGNGTTAWTANAAGGTSPIASVIAAPIAWKLPGATTGMVFVGNATADLNVNGQVSAFRANDGSPLWTTPTLVNPTPTFSGGAFWTSASLDPQTGELFVSASNPYADYSTFGRDGNDNANTDSVLSLNPSNGKINSVFQAIKTDYHDWDLAVAPTLYPDRTGTRKLLAVSGKDGFVYGLDRANWSQPLFKTPGIPMSNIDSPFPEAYSKASPTAAVRVCPGTIGGNQFTGPAYSPQEHALYVGMNDWCWFYYSVGTNGYTRPDFSLGTPPRGTITALDAETGAIRWQINTDAQVQAGLVTTSNGLVFAADTLGTLFVIDAHSGAVLKKLDLGGAVNSGLISYQVDGVQYVAAEVGGLSLNAPGITEPFRHPSAALRLKIFALEGETPMTTSFPRQDLPATVAPVPPVPPSDLIARGETLYNVVCGACHNNAGGGGPFPPLAPQQYAITDEARLKHFFETVAPPMPKLYEEGGHGLLDDNDVHELVAYFQWLNFPKQTGYVQPTSPGSNDWPKIYSVLTSPRCINCHTMTDVANGNISYPRQTDERHPHHYGVLRGEFSGPQDGRGTAIAHCTSCHADHNNDTLGIPGAPDWHLAPLSMAWESAPNVAMNGAELCRTLNPNPVDQNYLKFLLDHIERPNTLVTWAFNPGKQLGGVPRTVPPISYDAFKAAFTHWVNAGGPCPGTETHQPHAPKHSATKRR